MTKWPRPKEIHSLALPVRVMLSVRAWPYQVPVKVACVALSPPQPARAKVAIVAAGRAAIRDQEVVSPFSRAATSLFVVALGRVLDPPVTELEAEWQNAVQPDVRR
jgi:hypothetical protein